MRPAERLGWALERLALPPARDWIVRPAVRGEPVARFILPLQLCLSTNHTGRSAFASDTKLLGRMKDELAQLMAVQCRPWKEPLKGRPQVLAVRFSSREPDACSNFAKWAIDVLCRKRGNSHRLNIIEDDRPRLAEVHQWWEPCPRGEGFVFLEVRS